jgi:hypothetical protein
MHKRMHNLSDTSAGFCAAGCGKSCLLALAPRAANALRFGGGELRYPEGGAMLRYFNGLKDAGQG